MANPGYTPPTQATFAARYGSPCATCDDRIEIGDLCTWVDDQAAHADCERIVTVSDKPPCPRCHMVPATNGACGCET